MLQRLCEQLEYSTILDKANQSTDSCLRLAYASAFAVSAFYSTIGRMKKPFNPVLGETFEYLPLDNSFKFVSEQVSHHPPISAGYCSNDNFEWFGDSDVKSSFGMSGMEFQSINPGYIKLKRHKDFITYKRPKTTVKNLIMGEMYIEVHGQIPLTNRTTGDTGLLELKERGWGGSGAHEMTGWIKDKNGTVKYKLEGKWNSHLNAINATTKETTSLWKAAPHGDKFKEQFCFSEFTKQLNNIYKELLPYLPPTDSRLRPDQRALEHGDEDLAADEKHRLEEKQRARRKQMEQANENHIPKWFDTQTDEQTGEKYFQYKGGYFEARNARNFPNSLDIFS